MAVKKKTGAQGKSPGPAKKASPKKAPGKKTVSRSRTAPKKAGKKTGKKGTGKNRSLGYELKKIGLGIAILVAVCLTLAMLADIFIKSDRPVPVATKPPASQSTGSQKTVVAPKKVLPKQVVSNRDMQPVFDDMAETHSKKKVPGLKGKKAHSIQYEVFDELDPGHAKKTPPQKSGDEIPQIAIIIDDIGYDKKLALALFDLHPKITFSVLPFSPYGKKISRALHDQGAELMLHLPMEPEGYPRVNPGPGALLSSLSPDSLLTVLRKDLGAVPNVVGVNNHMGSKLTVDSDKMNQVFTILKKEGLFFIDSRTAVKSKGEASARLFRVPFAQRDIFLDNVQEIDYITGQFQRLVKIAIKHGTAIGIGHPYQATLDTLKIELPKLRGKVRVVPASRLVAIQG